HQRPRGPARVRTRDRRLAGGPRRAAGRRGGPAAAGPVPPPPPRRTPQRPRFRPRRTGEPPPASYLELVFPYYWHYDVLRALDYFRRAGADPDPRLAEAVEDVRSKRQPDGPRL